MIGTFFKNIFLQLWGIEQEVSLLKKSVVELEARVEKLRKENKQHKPQFIQISSENPSLMTAPPAPQKSILINIIGENGVLEQVTLQCNPVYMGLALLGVGSILCMKDGRFLEVVSVSVFPKTPLNFQYAIKVMEIEVVGEFPDIEKKVIVNPLSLVKE